MTHPQQPELSRHDLGETSQDGRDVQAASEHTPEESGRSGPTPEANQTEDERRSGETSSTYDG
jgi:hypothetical protein